MGYMGAWAKAWCLLTHAAAFPSHGGKGEPGASLNLPLRLCHRGQDESLVPPYTRGRVSLTGDRAKAWCLPTHAAASLSRGPSESLVPPYTRRSVSLSITGSRAKAWCLLYIHAEASPSLPLSLLGGQGERLLSPYTRGSISVSLSWRYYTPRHILVDIARHVIGCH